MCQIDEFFTGKYDQATASGEGNKILRGTRRGQNSYEISALCNAGALYIDTIQSVRVVYETGYMRPIFKDENPDCRHFANTKRFLDEIPRFLDVRSDRPT